MSARHPLPSLSPPGAQQCQPTECPRLGKETPSSRPGTHGSTASSARASSPASPRPKPAECATKPSPPKTRKSEIPRSCEDGVYFSSTPVPPPGISPSLASTVGLAGGPEAMVRCGNVAFKPPISNACQRYQRLSLDPGGMWHRRGGLVVADRARRRYRAGCDRRRGCEARSVYIRDTGSLAAWTIIRTRWRQSLRR